MSPPTAAGRKGAGGGGGRGRLGAGRRRLLGGLGRLGGLHLRGVDRRGGRRHLGGLLLGHGRGQLARYLGLLGGQLGLDGVGLAEVPGLLHLLRLVGRLLLPEHGLLLLEVLVRVVEFVDGGGHVAQCD